MADTDGDSVKLAKINHKTNWKQKLQLYTAKSQYWLQKAGASTEHWQLKNDYLTYEILNESIK